MTKPLVTFQLDIQGERQLSRAVEGTIDELTDLRPTFAKMADVVYGAVKKQFATDGAHGSKGWRKLKKSTIARKLRQYPANATRPLRARGNLKTSVTNKRSPEALLHLGRQSMGIGSTVVDDRGRPFWHYHQGGWRPMKAATRRRIFDLTEKEKDEMFGILSRRLSRRWLNRTKSSGTQGSYF